MRSRRSDYWVTFPEGLCGRGADVLALTDRLKEDLPQMLAEHQAIVVALEKLSAAAKNAGMTEYVEFARMLELHARTEEEVMYPAAVLVGSMSAS